MADNRSSGALTPEGDPFMPTEAISIKRSTFASDMERIQSGGLDDDPTDSGDPVLNKTPYANLKGGR